MKSEKEIKERIEYTKSQSEEITKEMKKLIPGFNPKESIVIGKLDGVISALEWVLN